MGVAVQLMVDAAVSGVMFTCNPVSGDPSTVAVNASWGLGLAVVGGEVTPDEYRVSKVTGEVLAGRSGQGRRVPARCRRRGAVWRSPPSVARLACLDDGSWRRWSSSPGGWSATSAGHQDIEWAIDHGGELFVLQSRPVTTPPAAAPARRDGIS